MASDVSNPVMGRSLLLALAFLPLCLGDTLVNKMHNISDTLRSDISDVITTTTVNYSEPRINTTYVSKAVFNMKGMGILYNVTPLVVDLIMQKQAYPEGVVHISDGKDIEFTLRDHWRSLLAHYAGLVSIVLLVAIFVVFFPIAGLCWCCCWCAKSRSRQPFDRKHDSCVRGVLALLLIGVVTLFMFGVVCSFVTDEHIETSTLELPATQRRAVADARAFLDATDRHQRHLLVTNYGELQEKLMAMIDSSGMKVSMQLGEFSKAVSVTTLNKMVQDLDRVKANLATINRVTNDLRNNASRLHDGLRKVKAQLLHTLRTCSQEECRVIQEKYKIGELKADIDYSQMLDKYFPRLPNVTSLLRNVSELLNGNIKAEVQDGQRVFNQLRSRIELSVNEHLPTVKHAIQDMGKKLRNLSDTFTGMTKNADMDLTHHGEQIVQYTERYTHEYGPYRRYIGIGACSLVLAVLATLVLGLLCGVCGKRPEGYGNNDCCNKGAGSRCLITGTVIMFLLGWAVAAVMLAYLLVGMVSQRFVCDPLSKPVGNRLFGHVDQFVDLQYEVLETEEEPEFNLQSVLVDCHANRTIYRVLHLSRVVDLDQLQAQARIELHSRVEELARQTNFNQPKVTILKESARKKLVQLAETGLSDFDFDKFTDVVSYLVTNITSIPLLALAKQLTDTADAIRDRPRFADTDVAQQLRQSADLLRQYQTSIVDPMLRETAKLNDTAIELRDGLKFELSSFKDAVRVLLDETSGAERYLTTKGPEDIRNLTKQFGDTVAGLVDAYLNRVVRAFKTDVGRCGPISNAFNTTHSAICRNVLMPVNGFWLSLAWCLLLFVPIITISSKLARLYTNSDPYPGPLVEAECMYDAYADRDNIPLANAYLEEKRAARRERGGGERAGGRQVARGGERRAAERATVALEAAAPVDAHNSRRYNDMAPKQWEEGPPRYHGPTEYERPPPYYYPGSNDGE